MLESNRAFNRTIYHLHQELEFTLPFEETFEKCRRFVELYERMYPSGLPYTLFEVRFTPEGHDLTLIGAGRDRRSTWIDLVCNDSCGFERYYAAAEALIREIGARPHLGKYCVSFGRAGMESLHQGRPLPAATLCSSTAAPTIAGSNARSHTSGDREPP